MSSHLFVEALNQFEEVVREHEMARSQRGTHHLVREVNNVAERLDRKKRALVAYAEAMDQRYMELANITLRPIAILKEQSE